MDQTKAIGREELVRGSGEGCDWEIPGSGGGGDVPVVITAENVCRWLVDDGRRRCRRAGNGRGWGLELLETEWRLQVAHEVGLGLA